MRYDDDSMGYKETLSEKLAVTSPCSVKLCHVYLPLCFDNSSLCFDNSSLCYDSSSLSQLTVTSSFNGRIWMFKLN